VTLSAVKRMAGEVQQDEATHSGERMPLACWFRRRAETNFPNDFCSQGKGEPI